MRIFAVLFLLFFSIKNFSQGIPLKNEKAAQWADSVYNTLSNDERIAQLMVVRLSSIDLRTKEVTFFDKNVEDLIRQYNIGSLCLFQGGPVKQASMMNYFQQIAKTPIMMCIDAEWGLGMRLLDSVIPLPKQMMLGAMNDPGIVYKYGQLVADQCRRFGVHVNYAPVVDVNNNPDNPVINDRSFGEDKFKVASFAIQYMKGMQDLGVMACAKHFPGHGDVAVDSHYDLPVINKTRQQLDSLELYPFRQVFQSGIASTMVAHLYIPAIDTTANRATSLSKNNVNGLLRNELHFQGLTFTDALDMKGVAKFFPEGESSVEALIAGNDMLCLPGDVPSAILKIKQAIENKRLTWDDIALHCKKVLMAKYQYVLPNLTHIKTGNLTADLNAGIPAMKKLVAENAITLLAKSNPSFFPLKVNQQPSEIAFVGIGLDADNAFASKMRREYNATVLYFNYSKKAAAASEILKQVKGFKKVVIGVHNMLRTPGNNFGLSTEAVSMIAELQQDPNVITFLFGNAYAVKNLCNAKNLVVCYEDDDIIQQAAFDMLQGKLGFKGTLPVTVCDKYKYGTGIITTFNAPGKPAFDLAKTSRIDSIVADAIMRAAIPGCAILVLKDGKVAFEKAYGSYTYLNNEPVSMESVYDMASVTKICATTISIMKLYEEGRLDLKKKLGNYLPWVKGSNKENLQIEKILLHQAGLVAYIPFYKETIDSAGIPLTRIYSPVSNDSFSTRVAKNLFIRNDWSDTLYKKILVSQLGPKDKYIYSDNDFIFLGKVVEAISGLSLDEYVRKNFYEPMNLSSIGFKPLQRLPLSRIVPTENEKIFRRQLLRGDVHDPGAAMFGGVAGHAGLFSNAYDIGAIMQMLLNGGTYNGKRYLRKKTVKRFTSYHSKISRRGYGFDKPEKDNHTRAEAYPTLSASPLTFGHTGFTGTCAWADPAKNLVFVFLSNRVNPSGSNLFLNLSVRPKIHETIYNAIAPK
ncbi:MAG TPA: glycoside hydrolase family 3 N-terminal domain-containing protein [Ferruginibacter sp.]|nr:glycoside hydrolase family 3 N-terminal domain-containing protein [Ferruginibacter sp.]